MPGCSRCALRAIPILLILLMLPSISSFFAKEAKGKKETSSVGKAKFKVQANIVVLNATVTDKDGNPVSDLKLKDFRVYDDGKLQKINTLLWNKRQTRREGCTMSATLCTSPSESSPAGDTRTTS